MTGPSQRLELRQSQKLIMTQRVQQSIKMLQLSNLELTDLIDLEARGNPLLEWRESSLGKGAPGNQLVEEGRASPAPLSEALTGELTSDAVERWQPEWREDDDRSVDFGAEAHR